MAIGILLDIVFVINALIQWGVGWRYVLSPSFRRSVHDRWRTQKRVLVVAEVVFMILYFLMSNGIASLVLWFLFFGAIRPIHEWGK
jgi:hypothetical protein